MDISTLQSFSGMSIKEIMMQPIVFAMWSTAILTMVITFGKSLPLAIYNRIKRYLSIVMTIDESDNVSGYDIFDSYNKWVINNRIEWLSRSFEVDTRKKIQSGQGFQVVWYKKSLFFVTMARREPKGQNSLKTIGYYSIVTAKWNRKKLDAMIQESCALKDFGQIHIHEGWNDVCKYDYPKYIIDQQQLISTKVYDRISETFSRFNEGDEYYTKLKMPYKETIMLYGPPGTGKTSLIRHLSALHNMNLILIDSSSISPSVIAGISKKSKETGIKSVILLEDITSNTALLESENVEKDIYGENIYSASLSKFLNTLDGANPLDNIIIVMTTNHIEKLDDAIYRGGRVDHLICMDYMNFDEANKIIFKWDDNDERVKYIKENLIVDKLSANAIMKIKNIDSTIDKKLETVIEDNNNFMNLINAVTLIEG